MDLPKSQGLKNYISNINRSYLTTLHQSVLRNSLSNSFDSTSVYPNINELVQTSKKQLPKNVTKGSYDSLEHYLNTHFTLLREDFIKPIREDLRNFLQNPNQRLLNIKIHEVQFIRKGVKKNDVCYCVEIKQGVTFYSWNLKRNPKRFMLGSLVIFTKDNFKTILCGRVVDDRNLKYRKMLVSFETPVNLKYEQNYTMIECNAFFEPYYQVLKVIQGIQRNKFPMQQYLVEVSSSVERPKYLKHIKYKITDGDLNESQTIAINGAINQELVIIQGPPGTGKTFLGLKIAKFLLSISSKWFDNSPILVISFTNHALDQFLEGLVDSTEAILRFGAQSRNPKMKNYTIRECRQKFYNTNINGRLMKAKMAPLYKSFCAIEKKIMAMGNQMDNIATSKPTCIFYFDVLAEGVPEMAGWSRVQNSVQMVKWLLQEDGSMRELSTNHVNQEDALIEYIYVNYLKSDNGSRYCMISVSIMENALKKMYEKITEIAKGIKKKKKKATPIVNSQQYKVLKDEVRQLTRIYSFLLNKLDYLKVCLRKNFNNQVERDHLRPSDPFKMPVRVRWQIYQYWLSKYEAHMKKKMDELILDYKPAYEAFKFADEENSLEVMKRQKIIGMTTTMAARMHSTIKALKCPIVIVEEAAEVLEAHIIPVLTEHCQHLILIGDHQQLQPTTADYEIETRYKLGVSLFERMVKNDIQCYTLNVQHRMRPEISSLITPSIYPVLHNHKSVKNFGEIAGMDKCLYFVTHSHLEENSGESSKRNAHEAKFLIQLAVYLLKNGHKPEEITILAAYLGQVSALTYEQKVHLDEKVKSIKVTSVDNFQGEENKIILLSLVRNNLNKKIGFLSKENRVCVALSRAKQAMYVMGNMKQLVECSQLWNKIRLSFLKLGSIGEALPLKCQQHGNITLIRTPEEFDSLSANGGCQNICGTKLKCGHKCKSKCHNEDLKHEKYYCMEPCAKLSCKYTTHKCPKRCYQPCGMCMHPLAQKLSCGHRVKCFMEAMEDYRCVEKVYIPLTCGHKHAVDCNEMDSDFEEDLDCSICKSTSQSGDVNNTTTDSGLLDEIEDRLGKIDFSDSDEESDSDLELPQSPNIEDVVESKRAVEKAALPSRASSPEDRKPVYSESGDSWQASDEELSN